jgi:predicted nucleic acid-binding Zn ribbon protein
MSEAPLSVCPKCGGELRRLINGGAGVIFKGSGFYSTDKRPDKSAKGTSTKDAGSKSDTAAPACASCPHSEGGSPCAEKAAG